MFRPDASFPLNNPESCCIIRIEYAAKKDGGDADMERIRDMACSHSVQRRIAGHVRIIQFLLYAAVVFFALIGTMGGLYWGIMAVGTLVFSWYYMGVARTTFVYELTGTRLRIQRVSGFASRPKTEEFAQFDLTTMRLMAPEGSPLLQAEDEATARSRPKRVVYDLTSHDRAMTVYVMFLEGSGADAGRQVKAFIEPSPELLSCIRRAAPGKVREE